MILIIKIKNIFLYSKSEYYACFVLDGKIFLICVIYFKIKKKEVLYINLKNFCI